MIFQHLVKITKDHEQILLLHKGGPEGEWIRSFNIPNATVQNLNDLCCPSVEKLVLKKRDYISSSIGCPKHIQGSNHCPVFECHVLFKWIQENTSIVQGVLERPSLPYEKADLFIEHRINMVDNHPFKKDSIKQNQKKRTGSQRNLSNMGYMLTMASLARFIINTASFNKCIYPLSQDIR